MATECGHAAKQVNQVTFVLVVGLLELLGVVAEEVGHLDAVHEVHVDRLSLAAQFGSRLAASRRR